MITEVFQKYKNAINKLILLDYDGTLVEFSPKPNQAKPSAKLLQILKKLAGKPDTKVVIITGRTHRDIDAFLGNLPLDVIAEHGVMFKENKKWHCGISDNPLWKKEIFPLLNELSLKCKDSYIEEKNFSLAWHYRNSESSKGKMYSRELIHRIEEKRKSFDLKILDGNKVVEIMKTHTDKGKAVRQLLQKDHYDFVLAIGDDATDEDMFNVLSENENHFTIKVGNGKTKAKYKLANVQEVISFLQRL